MGQKDHHCISCGKAISVGEICAGCARIITNPGIRKAAAKGRKGKG